MQRERIKALPLALAFVLLTVSGILPASALSVGANVNVIQPGSLNSGDQNHLQQNEPWITIDPANTNVLVAGANDYKRMGCSWRSTPPTERRTVSRQPSTSTETLSESLTTRTSSPSTLHPARLSQAESTLAGPGSLAQPHHRRASSAAIG